MHTVHAYYKKHKTRIHVNMFFKGRPTYIIIYAWGNTFQLSDFIHAFAQDFHLQISNKKMSNILLDALKVAWSCITRWNQTRFTTWSLLCQINASRAIFEEKGYFQTNFNKVLEELRTRCLDRSYVGNNSKNLEWYFCFICI